MTRHETDLPAAPPTHVTLGRGEARCVWAARGTRILSLGGGVWIEPTGAGGLAAQRLDDGECLEIGAGGWLTLTASARTELVCLPPPPPVWRRWLAAGQGWWRGPWRGASLSSSGQRQPRQGITSFWS